MVGGVGRGGGRGAGGAGGRAGAAIKHYFLLLLRVWKHVGAFGAVWEVLRVAGRERCGRAWVWVCRECGWWAAWGVRL